jgi:hypothetical protein
MKDWVCVEVWKERPKKYREESEDTSAYKFVWAVRVNKEAVLCYWLRIIKMSSSLFTLLPSKNIR